MSRWYYDNYFQPSRPRAARGGIKAQSKRGSFGQNWWAKRWIAVLESFDIGARLGRGKTYARKGQVLSIDVDKGLVEARVQGSRPTPYHVTIRVRGLAEADWKKLAREISRQAIFAAKLLAGEMPQDIEQAFEKAGLSLFPGKSKDLETDCSCPDWSNPCKHIAAVYYLLGEEFDRNPFLLFKLRGMNREEFIGLLDHDIHEHDIHDTHNTHNTHNTHDACDNTHGMYDVHGALIQAGTNEEEITAEPSGKSADPTARKILPRRPPGSLPSETPQPEPLTCDSQGFWSGSSLPDTLFGEVRTPPISAALPRRLGNFPFWRGEEKFLEAIEPIYSKASTSGMELFLGEWKPGWKI
ncbi:MAG: SWIM zinc finger family protein [bacterium]